MRQHSQSVSHESELLVILLVGNTLLEHVAG